MMPARGFLTYDAEGAEGGPYHSRRLHVPSDISGLTIGRGYDMRWRSREAVREDLIASGVDCIRASLIGYGARLAGKRAREFIIENHLDDFQIALYQQVMLFDIEYPRHESEAKRLATKADVVGIYGPTDWDALDDGIRECLIDLKFRGDYTPATRLFLQAHVVANDRKAFGREIQNRENWLTVPRDRFQRRAARFEQ